MPGGRRGRGRKLRAIGNSTGSNSRWKSRCILQQQPRTMSEAIRYRRAITEEGKSPKTESFPQVADDRCGCTRDGPPDLNDSGNAYPVRCRRKRRRSASGASGAGSHGSRPQPRLGRRPFRRQRQDGACRRRFRRRRGCRRCRRQRRRRRRRCHFCRSGACRRRRKCRQRRRRGCRRCNYRMPRGARVAVAGDCPGIGGRWNAAVKPIRIEIGEA